MRNRIILFLFFVHLFAIIAHSENIQKIPDPSQTLEQKFSWAKNAAKSRGEKEYWVGYSIQRLMGAQDFLIDGDSIMSGTFNFNPPRRTLEEVISGKVSREESIDIRQRAADLLKERDDDGYQVSQKVLRDVAILLQFDGTTSKPSRFAALNMNLPYDLKGRPLFWIGPVADQESFGYLSRLYSESNEREYRKRLIGLIALHQTPGLALPFLRNILKNESDEEMRKKAAHWTGEQTSKEALTLLLETVQNDRSETVRKSAVWGIAEMKTDDSNRTILQFARSHPSHVVRKTAIHALEDLNPTEVLKVLEEISWSDPDEKLRKTAMATLAELNGGKGVPALIKILENHPSHESRKAAIWMLQETNDPRAKKALSKVITQEEEE